MEHSIKIKKIKENAIIPKRATQGSAGLDLCACIEEPIAINSGDLVLIPTGIAIELSSGEYGAFIFARSGLACKYGLGLANGVGVVDSDYRGEIKVGLLNSGREAYTIQPNERIAQMVIMPVSLMPVIEVAEIEDTQRGEGGFGSTGF